VALPLPKSARLGFQSVIIALLIRNHTNVAFVRILGIIKIVLGH
jgi:hypothetical protein